MPRGRAKKVALPARWKGFVKRYGPDKAYWYWPKGLAVTPEAVMARLKPLKKLERSGKPWREVQTVYIDALNKAGVSAAESEWEERSVRRGGAEEGARTG
jgi:hypothetical protein